MIYDISARRYGKTTRAAAYIKANGGVMLVFSQQEKERIIRENILCENQVITLNDLKTSRGRRETMPCFIDNSDIILQRLISDYGLRLDRMSMTSG